MIDTQFNKAVLKVYNHLFPNGVHVADIAPNTLDEVNASMATGRLTVYAGNSDQTIFGDAKVNHAFRAWHDHAHWRGQYDFTQAGEYNTFLLQVIDMQELCPDFCELWFKLLDCEVNKQVEYYINTGQFVTDQLNFTKGILKL